jgi:hypothetical protein
MYKFLRSSNGSASVEKFDGKGYSEPWSKVGGALLAGSAVEAVMILWAKSRAGFGVGDCERNL